MVDGERESELSWVAALSNLKRRGLHAPRLAIGDGALGFWKAIDKVFPQTAHQGCTVHAMANALDKVPKAQQVHLKAMLNNIFQAATQEDAHKAFDEMMQAYKVKDPKAVATIEKRLTSQQSDQLTANRRRPHNSSNHRIADPQHLEVSHSTRSPAVS